MFLQKQLSKVYNWYICPGTRIKKSCLVIGEQKILQSEEGNVQRGRIPRNMELSTFFIKTAMCPREFQVRNKTVMLNTQGSPSLKG